MTISDKAEKILEIFNIRGYSVNEVFKHEKLRYTDAGDDSELTIGIEKNDKLLYYIYILDDEYYKIYNVFYPSGSQNFYNFEEFLEFLNERIY